MKEVMMTDCDVTINNSIVVPLRENANIVRAVNWVNENMYSGYLESNVKMTNVTSVVHMFDKKSKPICFYFILETDALKFKFMGF